MPRKVNIDLEYKLKIQEADRKKKAALEAVEVAYKLRLEKIEAWKAAQSTIAADVRPRMSKEDKEIQEAKERQKKMLEDGKRMDITPREKERASIFDAFTSLDEEEEEDVWEQIRKHPEDFTHNFIKSVIACAKKKDEEVPEDILNLFEGGKSQENTPPTKESEKQAEEAKAVSHPPILNQKSERGEKSEKKPPSLITHPPTYTYVFTQFQEPPPILSDTKVRKPVKTIPQR